VTIFVPETKNEVERKAVQHYFQHLKGFDRDCFDHLKKRTFSGVFLKLYDRRKHCISSEEYFE